MLNQLEKVKIDTDGAGLAKTAAIAPSTDRSCSVDRNDFYVRDTAAYAPLSGSLEITIEGVNRSGEEGIVHLDERRQLQGSEDGSFRE